MDMSFREKSAWISLGCIVVIVGYYVTQLIPMLGLPHEQIRRDMFMLLGKVVILSIIVEAIFHGMHAATNHKAAESEPDEREKWIELRANNWGYTVLGIGVVAVLIRMVVLGTSETMHASEYQYIPMMTFHQLMGTFILSEIVRFGGQIYGFRRDH